MKNKSDAIKFGVWLNQNASIWGNQWVTSDGKNYTTEEIYEIFLLEKL